MNINLCMGCMRELEGEGPCPHCEFDENKYEPAPHHLPLRTILNGKYLAGKVLGEGGFGITYLGWDLKLEVKLAIKEYYPNGFVVRNASRSVTLLSGQNPEFFQRGRDKFVDEAKRLGKFWGLPGIVSVKDYFQENRTAYIVMEFIEGKTLKEVLTESGGRMDVETVLAMMKPVMESLEVVHREGLIHRDISPDNIMIDDRGKVKLLDFGAARDFLAEGERSLSVVLKPGYAPEEQYRSHGKQGPWTDIYGLCATIYRAVTGEVPAESLDRVAGEKLKRPSEYGINMGKAREDTLMKGLEVYQKDRQQTVTELMKEMYVAPPGPDPGPTPIPGPVPPCEQTLLQKLLKNKKIVAGAAAVFVLFIGVAAYNGGKSKSESIEPENVLADGGSLLHDGADSKGGLETFVETEYRQQTETEYIQQTEGEKEPEVESWTDEEGNEYTGIRQNGTIQGEGICKYKDGRTYEGEFSNGFPHGKGVYTGSDGTKVIGISVNGLVTEVTKIEFSNGNRFEGSWNGDLDGDGTMYYGTGERYEGHWKNGEKDGDGIYYDKDGESSKQTWSEGTLVTDEKEEMKKKEEETEKDLLSQDYILPNSDSEYLDKSDIKGLSIKEINYAKNEIFARHGRKFKSRELQTYFNSKDWYLGTIDPDEFDNNCGSLLNKYEKKNSELLKEKEFSMESGGYKLDQ